MIRSEAGRSRGPIRYLRRRADLLKPVREFRTLLIAPR